METGASASGEWQEDKIRLQRNRRSHLRVDLRILVEQNKQNFIPSTYRVSNYVILRFGDHSDSSGKGGFISGVDEYLKVVERHASGLLPEMRKDDYEVRETRI